MISVLLPLYTVTKVLSWIWGPPFFPLPPAEGYGALPPALIVTHSSVNLTTSRYVMFSIQYHDTVYGVQYLQFLHAPTQNSKDLEKSTSSCDP